MSANAMLNELQRMILRGDVVVYDVGTGSVVTVESAGFNGDQLQINLPARQVPVAQVTRPAPRYARVRAPGPAPRGRGAPKRG